MCEGHVTCKKHGGDMEAAEEKEEEAFSCVVNKVRGGQCLLRDVDVYFIQQLFKSKIQRGSSDPRPKPRHA